MTSKDADRGLRLRESQLIRDELFGARREKIARREFQVHSVCRLPDFLLTPFFGDSLFIHPFLFWFSPAARVDPTMLSHPLGMLARCSCIVSGESPKASRSPVLRSTRPPRENTKRSSPGSHCAAPPGQSESINDSMSRRVGSARLGSARSLHSFSPGGLAPGVYLLM